MLSFMLDTLSVQVADLGAIAFVTIEPKLGLSSYGTADVQELVKMIAGYEVRTECVPKPSLTAWFSLGTHSWS